MYLNLISCGVTIQSLDWILYTGDKLSHQHAFPGFNPLCLSVCILHVRSLTPVTPSFSNTDRSGPGALIRRQWFNHNCYVLNVEFPCNFSLLQNLKLARRMNLIYGVNSTKKRGLHPLPLPHFKSSSANKSAQGHWCLVAAGSRPADPAVNHSDLSAATTLRNSQSNQTAFNTRDPDGV